MISRGTASSASRRGPEGPEHHRRHTRHQRHHHQRRRHRGHIADAHVLALLVLERGSGPLQLRHLLQHALRVQLPQGHLPLLEQAAQAHRLVDVLPLPLQGDQVAAHAVPHGLGPLLHPADLLNGHAQLPQQLDAPEDVHLLLAVVPVAVFAVAAGGEQALLLIEADILFCDAHQGLHLIDLHRDHLAFGPLYTLQQGEGQGLSGVWGSFLYNPTASHTRARAHAAASSSTAATGR